MSVEVTDWIWKHSKASGNDLIVLLKIGDNANADGGGAYPGIVYLSKAGRISKRAVYDCLRRLKGSGELVEEEHGGGRGRKTTYRVLMGKGAEPASNPEGKGAAGRAETVQLAARNGADPGSAYKEEPSLNRPKNRKNLPTPPATAPETEKAQSTQTLLKEHLDALDHELTTKGRLAATIKGLLGRGSTPEEVRSALARMRERNVTQPSALAGFIDQLRGEKNGHGNGYRNGQPERRGPTIPEADLSQLPPTDPDKLAAWYDRQLEGIPT